MKKGFTLMEILIVMSIVILIMLLALMNIRNQVAKAQDGQRKADLYKMSKAMEEYFNDNNTFPPDAAAFSSCGANTMAPYLEKIPCDPTTKTPYLYVPGTPTPRSGYVICAKLVNLSDPDISRLGCDPVKGCGWKIGYNYCLGSGMLAVMKEWIANGGPTLTPTPTAIPGNYACAGYICNEMGAEQIGRCPVTFSGSCWYRGLDMCQDKNNWCN